MRQMGNTKIIILDFDGTLGDTASVIIKTMKATINELCLPERADKECAGMIGLRLIEIPPVLFPEQEVDIDLFCDTYRRQFRLMNKDGEVRLYPNVLSTLTELKRKGKILTIASSRSHASLAEYVETLHLSDLVSYIVGADDVKEGKPHPESVYMILEKYKFKKEDAIMVGDTTFDIELGKNAGIKSCGVTYGNGSRESLAEADWIIDDFAELLDIID